MHHTVFRTPLINSLLRLAAIAYLKLSGWKVHGKLPSATPKCVLIAAPHTSNWDLPNTLAVAFVLRMNIYWMGKKSIFGPPFGALMRWLGGIPVDRSASSNMVAASAAAIRKAVTPLMLAVSPEGTRAATRRWKTGFYYIALEAGVPIVMAYMDYARKIAGIGPTLHPTGDIEKDMAIIKAFYAPFEGKNALQFAGE